MDIDAIKTRFFACAPAAYASMRVHRALSESMHLRNGHMEPYQKKSDCGYMITVHEHGGAGYAASSDFSAEGIAVAMAKARHLSQLSAKAALIPFQELKMPDVRGRSFVRPKDAFDTLSLSQKLDYLKDIDQRWPQDTRIATRHSHIIWGRDERWLFANNGLDIVQSFDFVIPELALIMSHEGVTIHRSTGRYNRAFQGGFADLQKRGLAQDVQRIYDEGLELLKAPVCEDVQQDLLIMPDQMYIQIHESIGHPLEWDRILGDERNYAGTSFVTPDMFGSFQYGSELLNVAFDPQVPTELATYLYDDEGKPAEQALLIERGVLKRGIGGTISAFRSGQEGIAAARSTHWNRPPIDRMGNINLLSGDATLEDLIGGIDKGLMVETNCFWSIDDSRNKFQFGCERGVAIKHGKKQHAVRHVNYRGISRDFWRQLAIVGDESTAEIFGTPNCGKGEPNQAIFVGHKSPACVFRQVQTFGS